MNMQAEPLAAAVALFTEDVTSEEGLGFPDGAAYVPDGGDAETAHIVWECLGEGRPAILVGESEPVVLIEPVRPRIWGRLRNGLLRRMTIRRSYRRRDTDGRRWLEASRPVTADLERGSLDVCA